MDFSSILGALGQGGNAMGGAQQGGLGFGLGQQMMQGAPGATQYAAGTGAQPGMMENIMSMLNQNGQGMGGAMGGMDPAMMSKLAPLLQMMQQRQNQTQGQPQMMPMMPINRQTNAMPADSRGYLAQGGGIAPRKLINV